ncbi:uncharacterized protein LOC105158703 isoform X2 [Sesamum indicum]|uniref:Uncharacterized protein LOC105158703 isoform X2 n=1 Tax=Sesamum indicum TaxID=4182 RepID=A0A8M8UX73_SESIN|nr:uncharacterized protein LOC105158703 isoform X2 [Sesamum indicum]
MRKDCSKTFGLKHKEDNSDDRKRNNMEMNMRSTSDKTLLRKLKKKKADDDKNAKSNRFLITINVFGSAGPIRFVVNEDETAQGVIETALKLYAKQGRLPVLGSDISSFFLYPVNAGFEVIGSRGARNFVLCKNQSKPHMTEARSQLIKRKGSQWRAWFQKSLTFKILSH